MARQVKNINHLLIITPGFPVNEADTACLPAVQQFVRCYQKQFPSTLITILTLQYPYQEGRYNWYGIDVYTAGGKNRPGLQRVRTILKTIKNAVNVNRKIKVDAVLSLWLTEAALAAKYISKITGAPHLIWMHGQDARVGNKYVRYVSPSPQQVAAISAYQNEVFKQSYGISAAHIIQNGINENIFPTFNSGERNVDLLAVGSLIPLKQYHLFIDLVKQLKEDGLPNIKAILAGEGILKPELSNSIKENGLEENITLTGSIPHSEVLQLMNVTKVFVHTSSYEGHSTVMLEALYSGCKVISFLSVGSKAPYNFTLCSSMEEIQNNCRKLLATKLSHQRVLYADMKDSALQVNDILHSML